MFTDSDGTDAGRLYDAALMLGVSINENMREQLGIESQDAFGPMINLGEQDGDLGWL